MLDFIEVIPNVVSKDDCKAIVKAIDEKVDNSPNDDNALRIDKDGKRDDISIFPKRFQSLDFAVEIIEEALLSNPSKYKPTTKKHLHKAWKLQRSSSGGGFTDWHTEQGQSKNVDVMTRFMVWMIYLNDVNKGGKTEFKYQKKALKPVAGTLVLWPAGYTHVHRAAPDLKENKYIATGWYNFS